MIQACFTSECRFYPDDTRTTRIRWHFAPPGFKWWLNGGPFHPNYFTDSFTPPAPGECGQLSAYRKWERDSVSTAPGTAVDGTAADFAGKGSVREVLLPDGSLNVAAIPPCVRVTVMRDVQQHQPLDGYAQPQIS